jgi:hypothetical protein
MLTMNEHLRRIRIKRTHNDRKTAVKLSPPQLRALRLAANSGGCPIFSFGTRTWDKLNSLGFVYTDRTNDKYYRPIKRATDAGLNYLRTEAANNV